MLCNRVLANAFGNHEHLALPEFNGLIFHLDPQMPFEHEEQFILIFMAMPRQRAVYFATLDRD